MIFLLAIPAFAVAALVWLLAQEIGEVEPKTGHIFYTPKPK